MKINTNLVLQFNTNKSLHSEIFNRENRQGYYLGGFQLHEIIKTNNEMTEAINCHPLTLNIQKILRKQSV